MPFWEAACVAVGASVGRSLLATGARHVDDERTGLVLVGCCRNARHATPVDAAAEFRLGCTDLREEKNRICSCKQPLQRRLRFCTHCRMRQDPVRGRHWRVVLLDHASTDAGLAPELEGRQERLVCTRAARYSLAAFARTPGLRTDHSRPACVRWRRSSARPRPDRSCGMRVAPSLSKSTPSSGNGNSSRALAIASMTSVPSRVRTGKHSVQPVATSVSTSVWTKLPES